VDCYGAGIPEGNTAILIQEIVVASAPWFHCLINSLPSSQMLYTIDKPPPKVVNDCHKERKVAVITRHSLPTFDTDTRLEDRLVSKAV